MLLVKLIALLKKDAILATRSKVWTLFELLLPVFILFAADVIISTVNKEMTKDTKMLSLDFTESSPPIFIKPMGLCDQEQVKTTILMKFEKDEVNRKFVGTWSNETTSADNVSIKDVEKKIADCKEAILLVDAPKDSNDIIVHVPVSSSNIPTEDFKTPFTADMNAYLFSSVFVHAIFEKKGLDDLTNITDKDRVSKKFKVSQIDARKIKIPEVMMPFFFAIVGISMGVTVVNVVRTVVTEKSTVKPYLSAIGLPGWLFYTEHFIATMLKSIITFFGAMKWFMGLEYVSLGVMMIAVIFYIIGAISFAILFSSIFTNAKRGIEAALICWVLLVCYPLSQDEGSVDILQALNINFAYKFYLQKAQISSLANHKLGAGDLFKKDYFDGTAPGVYLLMIIVDGIWMFALAIIFDRYGGKLASIKDLFKGDDRMKAGGHHDRDAILEGCIENEKTRNQAVSDVELSNVVKIYPTGEKAVNGLSFRAIRGQVSILLGQNGCGKSTTFSMISGVAMPTAGSIKVAGVDAVRCKDQARKFIGFCPQYNPLYDKLTVLEHLELVNALKEGPPEKFMAEAKQLLQAIRLADKTGTQSANLSGGMKRKLCVCMAMIGGSRVVLLDEPTAGMDPGARKDVQLMLEKIKVNRTILLTTHYMDEAERLGDWVFVMSYGRMAASGSLNFLKKKFGSGYVLTVVLDVKSDKRNSTRLVEEICSNIVPHSRLKDQRGQMIEVTLPEDQKKRVLPLLKALESVIHKKYDSKHLRKLPSDVKDKIKKLRITTLGLSLSSLETVFIRICDECDIAIAKEKNLEDKRTIAERSYEKLTDLKTQQRVTGSALQSAQFNALIQKRFYYTKRNYYQLFFQIFIPILIVIFGIILMKEDNQKSKMSETLDLNILPKCVVVLMKSSTADDDTYGKVKDELGKHSNLKIKEHGEENHKDMIQKYYKEKLGFIVVVRKNEAEIYYNKMLSRATPVLLTLAANWYVGNDQSYVSKVKWITSGAEEAQNEMAVYMTIPFFVTLGFALVTAPFVQFGIEERVCKFSHQQHLTGLPRGLFWTASIVWDSTIFILFSASAIVVFLAYNKFTDSLHLLTMMFALLLLCLLPITYVASLMFESPAKASSLLVLYQIVLGTLSIIILIMLTFLKLSASDYVTPILYFICPPSAFMGGFFKVIVFPAMSSNENLAQLVEFEKLWEWKGLFRDVFFLLLAAIISIVIIYAMQNRSTRVAIFDMRHRAERPIPRKPVKLAPCKAVFLEEQIVHQQKTKNCTVVVKDLVRVFGKFRAVNGLCVTVRNNECFGLLGTNGAGKTTTFDILTGLRFPSGGSAIIDGKDVIRRNYVGYCPQFDSILPDLKCIEALEIMAKLHGYADPQLAVKYVLTCVGMVEHAHKHIKMCSGGQKRKISVGIAMLTRARCIMMDEPTAGIDPRARREIWEILDWMREKSGSSIVLTSHSMEECEALCSRIAILRKGEMIAMGTSQDLKSQYGNTYTMTLIVKKISDRDRVVREVQKRIKDAVLKTAMTNITTSIVWELPKKKNDRWAKKYEKVEKLAKKLKVKDYMLTQSSLEDTFINLTD